MNKELDMPLAPQRIAVISSATAAGYGDFCDQLRNNPYGLSFQTKLFPAVMQGERVEESIISALESVYQELDEWDVVVLIRGGGATSDLSGFDTYNLAANCAQFPLPIVTGIGHERDETVLDIVAHTRVKTPTAAAEQLIACLYETALKLEDHATRVVNKIEERLNWENNRLNRLSERIPMNVRMCLQAGHYAVKGIQHRIDVALQERLLKEKLRLQLLEHQVRTASPEHLLKRGYSITLLDGRAVTDISMLKEGDVVTTRYAKGESQSVITKIKK